MSPLLADQKGVEVPRYSDVTRERLGLLAIVAAGLIGVSFLRGVSTRMRAIGETVARPAGKPAKVKEKGTRRRRRVELLTERPSAAPIDRRPVSSEKSGKKRRRLERRRSKKQSPDDSRGGDT